MAVRTIVLRHLRAKNLDLSKWVLPGAPLAMSLLQPSDTAAAVEKSPIAASMYTNTSAYMMFMMNSCSICSRKILYRSWTESALRKCRNDASIDLYFL